MPKEEPVDLKQLLKLHEVLQKSGHEQEAALVAQAVDELDTLRSQIEKMKADLEGR